MLIIKTKDGGILRIPAAFIIAVQSDQNNVYIQLMNGNAIQIDEAAGDLVRALQNASRQQVQLPWQTEYTVSKTGET